MALRFSKTFFIVFFLTFIFHVNTFGSNLDTSVRDLNRAISLMDNTIQKCFTGTSDNFSMFDTYDFSQHKGAGAADVWPYTAAIEATCSVLEALDSLKSFAPQLYARHHQRYVDLLRQLYDNLAYYRGQLNLNSYASVRQWNVYGVHRSNVKGGATVAGIENVYDDQMWLVRELVRAYRLTGERDYLLTAAHLADYVIDGWDCVRDAEGHEYGGITWGPGYNSKHSCSNGPIIQPLVWLHDEFATPDEPSDYTYYYCDQDNRRTSSLHKRSDVYFEFAEKVYQWQKSHLQNPAGVYWDMMGAPSNKIVYDTVGQQIYRAHVDVGSPSGTAYTYNSGTMLSGAAALYSVSGDKKYLHDMISLTESTWAAFAKTQKGPDQADYIAFPIDESAANGFNTWFDDVLFRSYRDASQYIIGSSSVANQAIEAFQILLDFGYGHYLRDGFLPIDLIRGWKNDNMTKGFHQLAFASEYAVLAIYYARNSSK